MAVDNAKIFNFQALKLLDYQNYNILANIRAAGEVVFNLTPELVEQNSGPSFYPIETEISRVTTEATMNIGEYGSEVVRALIGANVSEPSIESGSVEDINNSNGVDGIIQTGGDLIVSAAVTTTAGDIKAGFYKLQITDGTTGAAKLYALSSPDLRREEYTNFLTSEVEDVMLAQAAAGTADTINLSIGVTLTTAATIDYGDIETGDYVLFRVYRPGEAYKADIGRDGDFVPKVKVLCLSRTMSDHRWFEFLGHNAIFPGVNYMFNEEFSNNEVSGKLILDPTLRLVGQTFAYKETS